MAKIFLDASNALMLLYGGSVLASMFSEHYYYVMIVAAWIYASINKLMP